MSFKHNLMSPYRDECSSVQSLVTATLKIFPGSRILSPEEAEEISKLPVVESAEPERVGRERARASERKGENKRNITRTRRSRWKNDGQSRLDFLSESRGTL